MRNINIYYILILTGIIFIMLFYKNNSKKECFDIKNNYTLAGTIVTLEDQLKILKSDLKAYGDDNGRDNFGTDNVGDDALN